MELGFTGSRRGMTVDQLETLACLLKSTEGVDAAHHGDCVGADAQFHGICKALGMRVILHPPLQAKNRAFCEVVAEVCEPYDYLERDRHIVDAVHCLIACPNGRERLRSGTWATVRYARKNRKPILIILPDGKIRIENKHILPVGAMSFFGSNPAE